MYTFERLTSSIPTPDFIRLSISELSVISKYPLFVFVILLIVVLFLKTLGGRNLATLKASILVVFVFSLNVKRFVVVFILVMYVSGLNKLSEYSEWAKFLVKIYGATLIFPGLILLSSVAMFVEPSYLIIFLDVSSPGLSLYVIVHPL